MLVPLSLISGIPDLVVRIVAIVVIAVATRWLLGVALRRGVQAALHRHDEASRAASDAEAHPVRGRLARDAGWNTDRYVQRTRTLASLLSSIATLVITVVAVLMVMSLLGLPLTPILASAGIGGVAVGFGAQSLVKDFIGGVFMIFEDQYGVGDRVSIGTVTGVIDEVSLRVTRIRDDDNVIWYLRNGDIAQVGNRSQGPEAPKPDEPGPGQPASTPAASTPAAATPADAEHHGPRHAEPPPAGT